MTHDQPVAFTSVAAEGTFTGASNALHKSQPAVSKLIRNLEGALRGLGLAFGGKVEAIIRLAIEAVTPLDPIAKILRAAEARFPSVRVELHTERFAGAAEALHERRADGAKPEPSRARRRVRARTHH